MAISEEFCDALMDSGKAAGGCSQRCNCGRLHFDSDGHWDWNEGELEGLLKKQEKEPDKYIDAGEGLRFFEMEGGMLVQDCPCGRLEKIENWIWGNRFLASDYIHKRAKSEKQESDKQWEAIKDVEAFLAKMTDEKVQAKKVFYPNGNLKSIYLVNIYGSRIGRQRDFSVEGNGIADFEWGKGEYDKVRHKYFPNFDATENAEANYWHYLQKERDNNPF